MAVCDTEGCTEHYACRLRNKGIRVSAQATPTKTLNMVPTKVEGPSYNKQIIYDERPGGIKMPLLKPSGDVVRRKEWDENRVAIEANRKRIRQSNPLKE